MSSCETSRIIYIQVAEYGSNSGSAESIGLALWATVTEESSIVVIFKGVQRAANSSASCVEVHSRGVNSLYLGRAGEALEDKSKSD